MEKLNPILIVPHSGGNNNGNFHFSAVVCGHFFAVAGVKFNLFGPQGRLDQNVGIK
jgi:hypothetical protein